MTEEKPLGSLLRLAYNYNRPDDWSRYADDPDGLLNERDVPRSERRHQFEASCLREDPKLTAPRHFEPLYEEPDRGARPRRRWSETFALAALAVACSRLWDRLYVLAFGLFLAASGGHSARHAPAERSASRSADRKSVV